MTKPIVWPPGTGQALRCAAYCAAFTILAGGLCTVVIRLLPRLGGLFTDDEASLRLLESLGRAEVSPAWKVPVVFSLLLMIGLFIWRLRLHNRQAEPKRAIPFFFTLSLWAGFVPVFALTLIYTQVNTVPVKVVFSFIAMFLQ
ncbi:hypothetical protein [Paenibacillus oceani]|uniref:Uncharacterized protein n=1 Tax=Paenibacillus oceani TaxID=2772510 RepID=A0A927CCH7_9BACL|nr:hypothetical protein [Paenibacillus oceani]MBD2864067.1 hypothetical protein [Paenibacillus oceani]